MDFGSATFVTNANAITQAVVAHTEGNDLKSTGGNWVQYEQKSDPNGDGIYSDGVKLSTTMLDAYVVTESGSNDSYVVFNAGEFQDGISFQNVQNTYAATNNVPLTNDSYYVVELDIATATDTIESIALSLCNRDTNLSGFPFGANVNIKEFINLTGDWIHFTVIGDIAQNKLHIFSNGKYVTTTGYAYNTAVTGTKTPEEYGLRANGIKIEVKYDAKITNNFKILKNQSLAIDNVSRRDFVDDASIAELDAILASTEKDLTTWSKYPTNTRVGTSLPAYVEIDGVEYNNMTLATQALETSPTKVVSVLSNFATAFIPECDCTILTNGFSPKIWLPKGASMTESGGTITVKAAFNVSSSITGTTGASVITSAIKVNNSSNVLGSIGFNGLQAGHVSNALNSYLVTDLKTENKYWALHNYSASGASFINLVYNQPITYNASIDQYIVYDFDLAILGAYDPNYVFHSISRSSGSLCSGTSFLISEISSHFPIGEMRHVTMVYDLNANKSYLYVNNSLAASSNTGVMNSATYTNWKAGTASVKQESVRLQNISANQAIDNVSVRYITNDSSLKGALGSSLSTWTGATYSSSYSFPILHPAAIVNGEKVYFEDDVAGKIALPREGNAPHQVEILTELVGELEVYCNAVIETHGLAKVVAPEGMSVTEDGTVVTVTASFFEASSLSSLTGTHPIIDSYVKLNRGDNIIQGIKATYYESNHKADSLNGYIITDNTTSNDYFVSYNNNAPVLAYLDVSVNKEFTYIPSVNQYMVYDFDFAMLGDIYSNAQFASITRSQDNKTAYFANNIRPAQYTGSFPHGEMRHLTVIFDFNNNILYLYSNNSLVGKITTGVMSATGYTAWTGGAAVNHNSLRFVQPNMNIALDNVCARYVSGDASLASALGGDLSSWDGAIYSSSYELPTLYAAAIVDGEKVYFEEDLASKLDTLCDDVESHHVEILRRLDADLTVACNAVIETHGLATIEASGNMDITKDGTIVTVKAKEDMSLVTTVKLPSIYQSGMVFQRGESITVRGYCESPSSQIEVMLGTNTLTATTGENGEWEVSFPAMNATTGLTLTVTQLGTEDGGEPISLSDIAIGEVFLLSGQSNMDYKVSNMEDYLELKANADNYSNLRGYLSDNTYRHGEDGMGSGNWYKLTADNIANFPATGYAMATMLAMELGDDVTVAIVEASYPGSVIKTWLDADLYKETYGTDTNVINYNNYLAFYEENGRCPTSAAELSSWVGKPPHQILASCFDALIAPLRGYKVKAVVWDQGSGDLSRIAEYAEHYSILQDSFNEVLGTIDVPFIMHNLVPRSNEYYKDFLIEQYNIASSDKNTYLVSMGAEGAVFNSAEWSQNPDLSYTFVHTSRKSPIGYRAASVILKNLYGIDTADTPMVESIVANGSSVVITLTESVMINYGTKPLLFEIAGSDGTYHRAEAVILDNTITLTCDSVSNPKSVRYAYADFVIELNDGTIIEVPNGYSGCTMTADSLTVVLADGTTYIIHKDAYDSIRSYCTGNVISETGSPLPAFDLEIGYAVD